MNADAWPNKKAQLSLTNSRDACKRCAVYLRKARLLSKQLRRPSWTALSATIRYSRIAYWKREDIFGIWSYIDGRMEPVLNDSARWTAVEQRVSQVRWRCLLTASDGFGRSTEYRHVIYHTLVEQGDYLVNAQVSINQLCLRPLYEWFSGSFVTPIVSEN